MKTTLYNIKAEKIGEITLPAAVFGIKPNEQLIAQSIRVYLANQRKAYAKTKSRAQIRGTTKKVWAQKGTGRARHGSAKAPIFVGGGVAQGPRGNQNYTLKMSLKMKRLALKSAFSKFAADNKIIVIDKISNITPKTKEAIKFMTALKADNKLMSNSKKIAIVTTQTQSSVKRAFGNIKATNLLSLKSLNTYTLINQNFLIFSKKAIKNLTK